jgi:hypothetical protein
MTSANDGKGGSAERIAGPTAGGGERERGEEGRGKE